LYENLDQQIVFEIPSDEELKLNQLRIDISKRFNAIDVLIYFNKKVLILYSESLQNSAEMHNLSNMKLPRTAMSKSSSVVWYK
jgi:hypothetical protein